MAGCEPEDIDPPVEPVVTGSLPCDILLIQPPIRDFYLTAKRTVPYGLVAIAAALRQRGFRVAVLDALARSKSRPVPLPEPLAHLSAFYGRADQSPFALFHAYRHFGYALPTIAAHARRSGAFLVGIASLFSAYEDMALACATAVKESCPEVFVVLGGHHPTVFPHRMLDHPAVDFVLRGEGEAGLPQLAEILRRGGTPSTVPGIAYDDKNRHRHIHPPAYVEDLDRLPSPAADLVRSRFYARDGLESLVVAASRGCPLTCSYCCMGAHSTIPYRRRSVDHVMREIAQAAADRPIGLIDFEDENLTMDRPWFMDLLHRLTRFFEGRQPPELRAMNGLYPPSLDREMVGLMRTAGFRELNLSLGSCCRRQSRRFHRAPVTPAFEQALAWAEEVDLAAVGYLIAGAPGQDPMSSVDDLLFMAARRVLVGLSIYYPAPGSLDFEYCRTTGLLPLSPLAWRSSAVPVDDTTGRAESVMLLRLARLLNFMKQCVDAEDDLPPAQPVPDPTPVLTGTRQVIGRRLLGWFLHDGILRGVDPSGRVFDWPTDVRLTRAFLHGLSLVPVRGVRKRSAAASISRFVRDFP